MADLNTVTLVGRLTREPELRSTTSNMPVATLRLAVNGRRKNADGTWGDDPNFFDVVLFGRQAETAAAHLDKGRRIGITGRLNWREWTAQDGTRRQTVEIVAHEVQYLDPPKKETTDTPPPPDASMAPPDDDDVPF